MKVVKWELKQKLVYFNKIGVEMYETANFATPVVND